MARAVEQGNFPHLNGSETREVVNRKPKSVIKIIGDILGPSIEDVVLNDFGTIFDAEAEKLSMRQRIKKTAKEKTLSIGEKVILRPMLHLFSVASLFGLERNIARNITPVYPEGFQEKLLEMTSDPTVLPIIISNHQSLADGISTAVISKDITNIINSRRTSGEPFKGFALTIADSLKKGFQDLFIQEFVKSADKKSPEYNMHMVPFVRKKDENKYNMLRQEANRRYERTIKAVTQRDSERIADGLAYYVSGTMEEGRLTEGDKQRRKGLQPLNAGELYLKFVHFEKASIRHVPRKILLIPAVSDGGYKILDPSRKNHPRAKAIFIASSPITPKKSMLKISVGMPFFLDDAIKEIGTQEGREIDAKADSVLIDNYVGKNKFAPLLPPEARGVYA